MMSIAEATAGHMLENETESVTTARLTLHVVQSATLNGSVISFGGATVQILTDAILGCKSFAVSAVELNNTMPK